MMLALLSMLGSVLGLALIASVQGPTDEELVRRFNQGDMEAFSALVQRHQHTVYTICLRFTGSAPLAEELSQDVFLAVYKALPRFRGDAKFRTWLIRATINQGKNRKRYHNYRNIDKHEPLEGEPAPGRPERQLASEDPGTDSRVHRSEAERILQRALDELDENHRAVVVLKDIEDLPYEEIAEILGLPRGTVKSRLHRARAMLAKVLGLAINEDDIHE